MSASIIATQTGQAPSSAPFLQPDGLEDRRQLKKDRRQREALQDRVRASRERLRRQRAQVVRHHSPDDPRLVDLEVQLAGIEALRELIGDISCSVGYLAPLVDKLDGGVARPPPASRQGNRADARLDAPISPELRAKWANGTATIWDCAGITPTAQQLADWEAAHAAARAHLANLSNGDEPYQMN